LVVDRVTGPIFLIGMMGAGKTSVGRVLARSLDVVFIDLDERIELLFGASISRLFDRGGEKLFRARERIALRWLVEEPGFAGSASVVGTGGGIVVELDNLGTMSAVGRLVYLEVDVETLCKRLCTPAQRATRPLLGDEPGLAARLGELLAAREPNYRQAALIIDGRGSPEQVAARVLQEL
jgi:shikimate kinase